MLGKKLKTSINAYFIPKKWNGYKRLLQLWVLWRTLLQKSLPLLRHSLSLNKMHIDGVRPPTPMSVLPPGLPSSAAPVSVLPQLITSSSSVQAGASVAAQSVGGVVVQQPTAAGICVGSVVTAPRTAAVTQQTLPFAAVCIHVCCYQMT